MHLRLIPEPENGLVVKQVMGPVRVGRAAPRSKRIHYDSTLLPRIDRKKEYAASDIITGAMKAFARDQRVVSIDADLGTTSGLEGGVAAVDQKRALNVGVAEANMMSIGEAFAALGMNTWVSTFCPFFNWQVMRRIAVGHQERLESIAARDSWLSEGHALDLTFLATGPDFETRTNGATHMGNDDVIVFDGVAQLRMISASCPRQLLGVMKWIMEGNRGLVYLRVMRAPSTVLYGDDFEFEFGKAFVLRENPGDAALIVTSGRVHEALAAAEECGRQGIGVGVIDMPSVDEEFMERLCDSEQLVVFAEQNNGYLWHNFCKLAMKRCRYPTHPDKLVVINAAGDKPQYIHSGTYEQLLEAFRLSPALLTCAIRDRVLNRT